MVTDGNGNVYITGNLSNSVFFASLKPDGSLRWAKQWSGPYFTKTFNTLDDRKLGGVSNSLSFDGQYVYTIFNTSETEANNIFSVIVAKINPKDGSLIWAKKWKHRAKHEGEYYTLADNDIAYGIESLGKYLFVTGTTGENKVFLLALDKKTGEIFYQKEFELNRLKRDRGFVVRRDFEGNLYITGMSGNTPFLVKITSPETEVPQMGWTKKLTLAFPVRINDLAFDPYNNVYLSCFLTGPSTKFIIGKISTSQNVVWTKIFPAAVSPLNNSYTVFYKDGYLYAGGSIVLPGMNEKQTDGLIVKINPQDGKILNWAVLHKDNQEPDLTNYVVKSLGFDGDKLYVYGQVCGNETNVSSFDGRWYTADSIRAKDVEFKLSPWEIPVKLEDIKYGYIEDAGGSYTDLYLKVIEPVSKVATRTPDCDVFITKLKSF